MNLSQKSGHFSLATSCVFVVRGYDLADNSVQSTKCPSGPNRPWSTLYKSTSGQMELQIMVSLSPATREEASNVALHNQAHKQRRNWLKTDDLEEVRHWVDAQTKGVVVTVLDSEPQHGQPSTFSGVSGKVKVMPSTSLR